VYDFDFDLKTICTALIFEGSLALSKANAISVQFPFLALLGFLWKWQEKFDIMRYE